MHQNTLKISVHDDFIVDNHSRPTLFDVVVLPGKGRGYVLCEVRAMSREAVFRVGILAIPPTMSAGMKNTVFH